MIDGEANGAFYLDYRLFDICACKDGAIVFDSPTGTCNKPGETYIPSYERWQNPVVSWENN